MAITLAIRIGNPVAWAFADDTSDITSGSQSFQYRGLWLFGSWFRQSLYLTDNVTVALEQRAYESSDTEERQAVLRAARDARASVVYVTPYKWKRAAGLPYGTPRQIEAKANAVYPGRDMNFSHAVAIWMLEAVRGSGAAHGDVLGSRETAGAVLAGADRRPEGDSEAREGPRNAVA